MRMSKWRKEEEGGRGRNQRKEGGECRDASGWEWTGERHMVGASGVWDIRMAGAAETSL